MTLFLDPVSVSACEELELLADEFYHISASIFPFRTLKVEEIWLEYGICTKGYCDPIGRYLVKGNFISAHASRESRLKSMTKCAGAPRASLAWVLWLPVEIILETFCHVHPVDLFSLIRTTKSLRRLLLSRGSSSVWNSVFAAHKDIPTVPEGISPPKWTMMLFGPPTCDSCHVHPAMIDFIYNERLCQSCSPKLYSYDDANIILGSFTAVETCVRGTNKIDSLYYPTSRLWDYCPQWSLYFRKEDIDLVKARIAKYNVEIEQGVPGASVTLQAYLSAQKQGCLKTWESAKTSSIWAKEAWNFCAGNYLALQSNIIQSWQKYLKSLGHGRVDVDACVDEMERFVNAHYILKANRKEFDKWRKQCESMVACAKRLRLTTKVETFYDETVLHRIPTCLWSSVPSKSTILILPSVQIFINSSSSETAIEWTGVTNSIAELVHRWLATSEIPIHRALDTAGYSICESDIRSTVKISSMAVFICHAHQGLQRRVLIGWESIAPHLRCLLDKSGYPSRSLAISFSDVGRDVVNALVSSIGRDIYTATISDLDEANEVFVCGDCGLVPLGTNLGSYFYTWRQAVQHGVMEKNGHISFIRVTRDTRQYILSRQRPVPDPTNSAWACNHCSEHHCKPIKRSKFHTHLAKIHRIKPPTHETDVTYVGDWTAPEPVFLSRQPSECYRCLLCKPGGNILLHREQPLKMHLADKHHESPMEGINWMFLEIPDLSSSGLGLH